MPFQLATAQQAIRFLSISVVVSRLRLNLVFHRLQLGSHICLLLLQQCLALFRLSHFLLFASTVECQTGTARNQAADNHVLFQAAQTVALAHDRRFGQQAGSPGPVRLT